MGTADTVPEGRCGFILEVGDVPGAEADDLTGPDTGGIPGGSVCCRREVWDGADDGRCIWHAETDEKPREELIEARAAGPERLDKAYVPAVDLNDAIDFEECELRFVTFAGTGLEGVSFAGIEGLGTQFPNANLSFARFNDADLLGAQFPDTDLLGAQFPDATLKAAVFPNADLWGAQFPNADLHWAEFPEANLWGAKFPDADLPRAQFPDADLMDAEFPDADLRDAEFPDANLRQAQFPTTDLFLAQFPNADLSLAQFPNANLLSAQFPNADLEGVEFPGADLRRANFDNARMDLDTVTETAGRFDGATVFGWSQHEIYGRWDQAARTYRAFQQTLREHAMPAEVRRYRVREMHMRRKAAFPARLGEWAKLALARWTTLYGESPWRVGLTSLAVVLGSAVLYQLVGPIARPPSPDGTAIVGGDLVSTVPMTLPGWLSEFLTSVYFSVVTFTTLGYGDLRPATPTAQLLVTVESFLGALLMALLVYVLGRRATW